MSFQHFLAAAASVNFTLLVLILFFVLRLQSHVERSARDSAFTRQLLSVWAATWGQNPTDVQSALSRVK